MQPDARRLIAVLRPGEAAELAEEPALGGLVDGLHHALAEPLAAGRASAHVAPPALAPAGQDLTLAFLLLTQMPRRFAHLGAIDAAGRLHEDETALELCEAGPVPPAVFYRFDLDALRERPGTIRAAG